MKDYSPLFNQGLFSIVATPAVTHFRKPAVVPLVVLPPPSAPTQENSVQARRSRRHVNGRSFLHLNKTSVHTDEDSFKVPSLPRTATGVTFQSSRRTSSSSSTKLSSPTSPSRRALPLAKPAPLSSLPAIPISTAPTASTSTPSSPIASSAALPPSASSSSSAAHKKHASLSPSFFSNLPAESVLSDFLMDMTASPSSAVASPVREEKESLRSVSTAYRKRRRQDALQALEGRGSRGTSSRRRDRAPSSSHQHHHHNHITSFMPSILHEVEEAEDPMKLLLEDARAGCASSFRAPTTKHHLYRSHLSFGSTAAAPHAFAVRPPSRDSNAIFSAASSVAPKRKSSKLMSPTTPCFSVSYPGEDSLSVLSSAPRRASTTGPGASKGCGWGMNFIDLVDDDGTSSIWRWSHVA
ncbi:hypothetical protein FRC04_005560 [Tulasnella sp. 424]|nr:hypothetical protein FRC04_005560 [Tulasnella sp. 424]KAG8961136.1 hypothetical protein FRC05_006369 [Tulasnella sp. 425]